AARQAKDPITQGHSMNRHHPLVLSIALATSLLGSTFPAQAHDYHHRPDRQDRGDLLERAARGDLSRFGGARRVDGDLTQALKASLSNKRAKNVILLIGDGMGDSEITLARNYAEGAGGYFKGIDALPLTGQYTHYALDKNTGLPNYVADSASSA